MNYAIAAREDGLLVGRGANLSHGAQSELGREPPANVLAGGDDFEMIRIDAGANATKMIELRVGWDGSVLILEVAPVSQHGLSGGIGVEAVPVMGLP